MPRATAAVAAETARRVLEVARDRFAADGFAAASVDDIARRAGVTRGAVYHHYDGKLGLFVAVAERLQAEIAARVVAEAEKETDAAAQLRAGSHAFLDAITDDRAARILLVDAPAALGWSRWRELDAAASGRELREAVEALETVPEDLVDALAQQLSGAMNEAALWLADRPGDARAREAAHSALDLLLVALTPS
ncbi:helix-turn-helix domain-containing protein [Microbacterium sp. M3]|uniref:Helix-turn-helix domain-containing protein n=1 Tax=Microbacterium arthrosphaerae TaxID=792652 RepID=A0ABU4GZ18_9MICO|nr:MULTISPECIES: helix-turn-helix domain-containing protein [Microbacterium]MDW4572327.1 helix-turn-helix domain-containing protein [Microbacterium arthrosphaerae]MDW7606182.1 helix-turn-helix domain-containing protein [Microbacterium sp. M3]